MELLLKVGSNGPDPEYQDGDVVCAFNERRILCCHAEMICHVQKVELNSEGLNPEDCLTRWMLEQFSQFKFERVSDTEVKRTNTLTGSSDIIDSTPNNDGEYMLVDQFLANKRKRNDHNIFGRDGAEVWFGGKIDTTIENVNLLWDKIESESDNIRADHKRWPLTSLEKMRFFGVNTNHGDHDGDCDDEECEEHVRSSVDEHDGSLLKKRAYYVHYTDLSLPSSVSVEDIRNPEKLLDIREEITFAMEAICSCKDDHSNH